MESLRFTVTSEESKTRLDIYLTRHCADLTRSRIKKLITDGHVLVDGRPVKAGVSLVEGTIVSVNIPEAVSSWIQPQNIPLTILFEDDQLLVLDKSPDMVVHPSYGHPDGTLVNAIMHHCSDLSGIGGVTRPGIVHRLDKGTSGVMVVAKNDPAHQSLAKQFKNHSIGKMYLAAVKGGPGEDKGLIEKPLGRHPKDRKRIAVRDEGRSAITEYTVLARQAGVSLVELRPETGRTHQLRVHMASIGHPILGDSTYGGGVRSVHMKDQKVREYLKALKRPALHAYSLSFEHPSSDQRMKFTADPPEDLAGLFNWIRGLG